ncbi:MAG: nucleotide-binding protein [Candidatus Rokubacteria bacterium]|nr:nucleotide-binding protein [Candidatus Rokubacteria bacterium]
MAAENSFDVACKVDMQEVANAINQARKEIETRYLHRRGIDLKALTIGDPEPAAGGTLRQTITLQDGIPVEKAREIVRLIKDSKIRVQASIQEKQVRVAGKNRDDLQAVIALLKAKDLGIALQFTNYRST